MHLLYISKNSLFPRLIWCHECIRWKEAKAWQIRPRELNLLFLMREPTVARGTELKIAQNPASKSHFVTDLATTSFVVFVFLRALGFFCNARGAIPIREIKMKHSDVPRKKLYLHNHLSLALCSNKEEKGCHSPSTFYASSVFVSLRCLFSQQRSGNPELKSRALWGVARQGSAFAERVYRKWAKDWVISSWRDFFPSSDAT